MRLRRGGARASGTGDRGRIRTYGGKTLGRRGDITIIPGKKRRSKRIEGGGKLGGGGDIARDVGKNGGELSSNVGKKGGSGVGKSCANVGILVCLGLKFQLLFLNDGRSFIRAEALAYFSTCDNSLFMVGTS